MRFLAIASLCQVRTRTGGLLYGTAGIYIMQNTMLERGGWSLGKKIKNEELGEKIKKGKEKGRKIT